MTTITANPSIASPRAVAGIGVGSGLVAMAGTAFGAHDWGEVLVVSAILVVTTALVFGLVLPLVLGVAGALIGNAGRRAPTGANKCIAAMVLGTLASIGYLAIYVSDGLNGGAGFLFD